ncbi:peptide chain release factor N(5)-glutamine methyltransferase [Buchnera aphidicola]|uniref:Release factor glutamine methyltransferase n=1 Tax=Buchnera aphidicola (Anoecia oenotherae) TaxID=1241833 RepID=A0A4D6XQJ7_9GAMM|nr:peptide chain release factor N(5)-glutamine methyltransferase [Buchnera aphidicola]QCI19273.1 peptide chain release factor N(5)-glutamine methyltransferase [Buchnera aphidicola (Anoecia oenotherae)]
MNIKQWIQKSTIKLSNIHSAQLDSKLLIMYVLKINKEYIIFHEKKKLTCKEIKHLKKLLIRRYLLEPIAYITKKKEFWSLNFHISKYTLIPRPDTEILVEKAIFLLGNKKATILDLGTGCGNIAISIASMNNNYFVTGVDINKNAILMAKYNSKKLHINNTTFFISNWFSNIKKKFHMIVSNPPYINKKEFKNRNKELSFEPKIALYSPNMGLGYINIIINNAKKYLHSKGWIIIEHGFQQKNQVKQILKKKGFLHVQSYKDYGGNYRITIGNKPYIQYNKHINYNS